MVGLTGEWNKNGITTECGSREKINRKHGMQGKKLIENGNYRQGNVRFILN